MCVLLAWNVGCWDAKLISSHDFEKRKRCDKVWFKEERDMILHVVM